MLKTTYTTCKNDHKYLNIELYNSSNKAIPAEYLIERTQPIIDNPSEYYISVIRFNIPGASIPIFKFLDNKYYVSLSYNNNYFSQVIIYSGNNVVAGINYVYHYQEFIDMINIAYQSSFTALKTAFPAALPTEAPYITFDANTELCTLWCQQSYENNVKIYMNGNLYTFFDNFNVKFNGFDLPTYSDFELIVKNNKNNIPSSPANYYIFPQEFKSLDYWNDLRSIVFVSASMPIQSESIPSKNANTGSADNRLILTDFQPDQSTNLRAYLQYQPSLYRYTDLLGIEPLRKIDLKIFWESKTQELSQLYIGPGDIVSVKIMFQRKGTI